MMINICDIDISVQPISAEVISHAKRLYSGYPHKVAIWDWQFSDRMNRKALAATAWHEGKLVGFNALMPVTLKVQSEKKRAWWSCDFIVDRNYRGYGIGSRLKDEVLGSVNEPIMSLGISDSALPILEKKGWVEGPKLPVYEKVLKPRGIKQRILSIFGSSVFTLGRFLYQSKFKNSFQYVISDVLPSRFIIDKLVAGGDDASSNAVVKDYDYLSWRYATFPFSVYRFTLIFDSYDVPVALIVHRITKDQCIEIVEFLGEVSSSMLVYVATRALISSDGEKINSILWRISANSPLFSLWRTGFVKKRYGTRFVYRLKGGLESGAGWLLSSGDSDGEFLAAAKECYEELQQTEELTLAPINGKRSGENLSIKQISEKEFSESRQAWNTLLNKSSANPMFMSWDWQYNWWKIWGDLLGVELYLHFIYSGDDLVGILPLFRTFQRIGLITQYHFIGNAWRIAPSIRSEYISPILTEDQDLEIYAFVDRWMRSSRTLSYFVIQDYVGKHARTKDVVLVRQVDYGYAIPTHGDLDDYKNSLGKQTRLRAFNRIDYLLASYPDVSWEECGLSSAGLDGFFRELNAFHVERWGKPCFSENAVQFHKNVIQESRNIVPLLHRLKVKGRTVSLSYNLICDGVMYNLQSGFVESFDKKISLGTLHFGKIISIAFDLREVHSLDLLAGKGKRTDYKNHFKGHIVEFRTLQIFSSRLFYKIYQIGRVAKSIASKIKGGSR